jgi:hypothetical protein
MTACIPSITKTCRDNDRTRSDKEVLEKLVVTDMVLQEYRILNREGIRSIPAPDRPTSAPDIFTPTSSRRTWTHEVHQSFARFYLVIVSTVPIRKRHVGCH